jgi:hypothetical protein
MADPPSGPITLLTDFGLRDGYVGVMKGVIAGLCPKAETIDIGHEIPPQDIRSAAFLIERSFRYFPAGTVHVVVVDPGVGSERKGLVLRSEGHYFVGPDNGVFTGVLKGAEVRNLGEPKYWLAKVSSTFHGRDIFSPVAAHLANGVPFEEFGPKLTDPVFLPEVSPERTSDGWKGRVVYVDRFGNLVTNLGPEVLDSGGPSVIALEDGSEWPVVATYSSVGVGERCAVVGGFDRLELSINGGSAAEMAGVSLGRNILLGSLK